MIYVTIKKGGAKLMTGRSDVRYELFTVTTQRAIGSVQIDELGSRVVDSLHN